MMPTYSRWDGGPVVRAELESDDPDVIQTGERLTDDDHRLDALRVFREPWPFDWTPPGAKPDVPWDCDVYPSTNGRHAGGERRIRESEPPGPRVDGDSFYAQLHTRDPSPSNHVAAATRPSWGTWVSSGPAPSLVDWAEQPRTLLGLRVEINDELDCDVILVRPGDDDDPHFTSYDTWYLVEHRPELRLALTFDHPQRDDGEIIPRELRLLMHAVRRQDMPLADFHWEVTPATWYRLAAMTPPGSDASLLESMALIAAQANQWRQDAAEGFDATLYHPSNPLLIVANTYQVATVLARDRGLRRHQWLYAHRASDVRGQHGGDYVLRTTGVITNGMRHALEALQRAGFRRIA